MARRGRTTAAAVALLLLLGFGFSLGGAKGGGGLKAGYCVVWVRASGYEIDGQRVTLEEAVARCTRFRDGAEVRVTGAARMGDLEALRAALAEAQIAHRVVMPGGA